MLATIRMGRRIDYVKARLRTVLHQYIVKGICCRIAEEWISVQSSSQ